jgi:hypothetical protein
LVKNQVKAITLLNLRTLQRQHNLITMAQAEWQRVSNQKTIENPRIIQHEHGQEIFLTKLFKYTTGQGQPLPPMVQGKLDIHPGKKWKWTLILHQTLNSSKWINVKLNIQKS